MKDVKHNRSEWLNRLGLVHVPNRYTFSSFPLFSLPLIPLFFIFICPSSHSLCKRGPPAALPRTLHCLSFAQVFPVRTPFASQRNRFAGDFASQSLFTLLRSW
jgi:hypothetical protein